MTTTKTSYEHKTQRTDWHIWKTQCEQYGKRINLGSQERERTEKDVTVKSGGRDIFGQRERGFNLYASEMTANGMRQLAEFILSVVPELERIESTEA